MSYRGRNGLELVTTDGKEPPPPMPCMWCKKSTAVATLMQLGARCHSCFETYCEKGVNGGERGFLTGRRDTVQQAEMRRWVKA